MPRQSQAQTQQQQLGQKLSPQQVAFGRVLEMSAAEFEEETRRTIDENPALEVVESQPDETPGAGEGDFNETAEQLQQGDYVSEDDMPTYPQSRQQRSSYEDYTHGSGQADDTASGYELLEHQLDMEDLDALDRSIATYIIGNIDDNGRLTRSVVQIADDIAIAAGLDISETDVERVLSVVRSLEPAGIAAFDLRDCLLLQLDRKDTTRQDVADARMIIADKFELFSNRHFDRLGLSRERVDAARKVIRGLNPKPGSLLQLSASADRTRQISPDFFVDVDHNGRVSVSLAGNIPELAVDRSFQIDAGRPDEKAFIKERRDQALAFIDMSRRRTQTLLDVMEAIVRLQPDFFKTFDRSSLRPMVLRDVKALTGHDLSVISRATASKYVSTPQGNFLLKSLFSEASGDNNEMSSHAVLDALKQIVENEDPASPLSDDAISEALANQGIAIARRTVAKYRERLGIPVARLRRN